MSSNHLLPGQGLMFNTNKRKGNYPDFRGHVRAPSGEIFEIAAWFKTTKRIDTDYLSIKLTSLTKDEQQPEQDIIPDNEER